MKVCSKRLRDPLALWFWGIETLAVSAFVVEILLPWLWPVCICIENAAKICFKASRPSPHVLHPHPPLPFRSSQWRLLINMADQVKVLAILQVFAGFFLLVICISYLLSAQFFSIVGIPLGIWVSNICFLNWSFKVRSSWILAYLNWKSAGSSRLYYLKRSK